ncbi:hypothetical protein NEOLEDRAFT_1167510 [Neolentinus lepideus HHB14362 ss-1]|uniref:Uncharacterized protein n=1 Tax=Neolentinus lepideus HHB14362 ss-1 TaxID=1314782 RepID=A0A165US47_9AGAM|nr:hypothetical protein NEOLEDRAFT_1167510 [Neolentinus lepideus HHB14362 ss-1]
MSQGPYLPSEHSDGDSGRSSDIHSWDFSDIDCLGYSSPPALHSKFQFNAINFLWIRLSAAVIYLFPSIHISCCSGHFPAAVQQSPPRHPARDLIPYMLGAGHFNEPPVVYPSPRPGESTSRSTRFRKAWRAFERGYLLHRHDELELARQDILAHLHATLSDPPPELLEESEAEEAKREWEAHEHGAAEAAIRAAQEEFYEQARGEWAAKLGEVGLAFGEWSYVTPIERAVVEKVLGMPVTRISRVSRVSNGRDQAEGIMGGGFVDEPEELEEEKEEEEEGVGIRGVGEEYHEQTEEIEQELAVERTASGRGVGIRRRWGTLTKRLKPAWKRTARAEVREPDEGVRDLEATPTDVYLEQPPEVTLTRRRRAERRRQTQYADADSHDESEEGEDLPRPMITYRSPIRPSRDDRGFIPPSRDDRSTIPLDSPKHYDWDYATGTGTPNRSRMGESRADYVSEEEEERQDIRAERRRELTRGEDGTWGGGRRKLRKRARPMDETSRGRTGLAENMRRFVGRSRSRNRPPSLT